MSRQAQIVRWYLVRLALVGLCLAWDLLLGGSHEGAVLAMAGLGNFPGCSPCCGTVSCGPCSDASQTVTVVVAGYANNTCTSCSIYNGTSVYTIPTTVTPDCLYLGGPGLIDPGPCIGDTGSFAYSAALKWVSGGPKLQYLPASGFSGTYTWSYTTGGSCNESGDHSLTLISTVGTGGCDSASATVTATI